MAPREVKRSILITGVSGLVGSTVYKALLPEAGRITGVFHTTRFPGKKGGKKDYPGRFVRADLSDPAAAKRLLDDSSPTLVVNCAACPDIAPCEADPAAAARINAALPALIASWCRERGVRFIHFSTDQVFNGAEGWYTESDPPAPVHVYGSTKAEGESGVLHANPRALVMRIALAYGGSFIGSRSVSERLVRMLKEKKPLSLYTNEYRTPVLVDDVARAVCFFADRDCSGIVHVAGPDRVNRMELGLAAAREFGLDESALSPGLSRGLEESPPRPLDLSLHTAKARSLLPFPLRGVREGLAACRRAGY